MLNPVRRFGAPLLAAIALVASPAAWAQESYAGAGDTINMGAGVPDYYTVQPGDTLWEISSKFLGNAYYWPRLWSINDYITNPHWIYPGNRIVFRMGTLIEPPQVELDTGGPSRDGYVVEKDLLEDVAAECGPNVRFDNVRDARSYNAPGYLADKDDLDIYGEVEKARGIQTYLSERDLLYLKLEDPDSYECGDVISIFRRVKKRVKHPTERVKFGGLYRVVAEARVVHRYEDYVTAAVQTSYSEIVRGDLVGPPTPVTVEIEVAAPKGDIDATIVERVADESFSLGTGETIFLDRGRGDGVRVGNTFYVTEQRDEYADIRKEDPDLPHSVIGRVVVVRVDEYTSTAVVTDASKNLSVGNRLTQKVE
jgi:hypothetical protein